MKGSSKVVMGTTMAIVVILLVVLGLVLVLLAELYCSLLFRRKKLGKAKKLTSLPENLPISSPQHHHQSNTSPLSSFYAQGVLNAPRSFLFPKLPSKRENSHNNNNNSVEQQRHGKLHEFLRAQSPHQLQLGVASTSPSLSYISVTKQQTPHQPIHHDQQPEIQVLEDGGGTGTSSGNHVGNKSENLVYISNPIYDNDVARASRVDTPFETPDSSPSHLGRSGSGSSGDELEGGNAGPGHSSPSPLPLTPMKELPAKASSVSLKDARSLGASCSDTNSHIGRSSSSSGSPCTSPSW